MDTVIGYESAAGSLMNARTDSYLEQITQAFLTIEGDIFMPIKIDKKLPAVDILSSENIFVMDDDRADHQDIRPLNILVLNLML